MLLALWCFLRLGEFLGLKLLAAEFRGKLTQNGHLSCGKGCPLARTSLGAGHRAKGFLRVRKQEKESWAWQRKFLLVTTWRRGCF